MSLTWQSGRVRLHENVRVAACRSYASTAGPSVPVPPRLPATVLLRYPPPSEQLARPGEAQVRWVGSWAAGAGRLGPGSEGPPDKGIPPGREGSQDQSVGTGTHPRCSSRPGRPYQSHFDDLHMNYSCFHKPCTVQEAHTPGWLYLCSLKFTFSHLADALIQSD